MRGEGTAARGVPVRQIQLQISMMDGCCSFSFRGDLKGKSRRETKRESSTPTKSGA
jgi:hypothetical protein